MKRFRYFISVALILVIGAGAAWAESVWEGRIQDGDDDVEQRSAEMYMDSSDLEFVADGNTHVGIRFVGVLVPQGSAIFNAYMEFQVDELEGDQPANLIIYGDLSRDAPAFDPLHLTNVSDRRGTEAQVVWLPIS